MNASLVISDILQSICIVLIWTSKKIFFYFSENFWDPTWTGSLIITSYHYWPQTIVCWSIVVTNLTKMGVTKYNCSECDEIYDGYDEGYGWCCCCGGPLCSACYDSLTTVEVECTCTKEKPFETDLREEERYDEEGEFIRTKACICYDHPNIKQLRKDGCGEKCEEEHVVCSTCIYCKVKDDELIQFLLKETKYKNVEEARNVCQEQKRQRVEE